MKNLNSKWKKSKSTKRKIDKNRAKKIRRIDKNIERERHIVVKL